MRPVPPDIAARWSPMWPNDHYLERPWWSRKGGVIERADGTMVHCESANPRHSEQVGVQTWMTGATAIRLGPRVEWDTGRALEWADRNYPLPVPPPMPGQVWAWPSDNVYWPGRAAALAVVSVKPHEPLSDRSPETGLVVEFGDGEQVTTWPPLDAVLVTGPTPWGRDVPWGPA